MDIIRQKFISKIDKFLDEKGFRAYEIYSENLYRQTNVTRTIHLLRPTKNDLENALNIFVKNGYSFISIYL